MGILFSKRTPNGPQKVAYGESTFILQSEDLKKIEKLNEQNWKMLESNQWIVENLQYVKNDWPIIFSKMLSTKIQRLSFYCCGSNNILEDISHVRFNQLQLLALGKNKINNIEALTFIDLPCLTTLRLNQNLITNFKPLNKLMSQQLNCLVIHTNPYVVLKQFHRVKLNCQGNKMPSKISLQERSYWNNQRSRMHDDITFLMKLQIKELNNLNIEDSVLRNKHLKVFSKKNLTLGQL